MSLCVNSITACRETSKTLMLSRAGLSSAAAVNRPCNGFDNAVAIEQNGGLLIKHVHVGKSLSKKVLPV